MARALIGWKFGNSIAGLLSNGIELMAFPSFPQNLYILSKNSSEPLSWTCFNLRIQQVKAIFGVFSLTVIALLFSANTFAADPNSEAVKVFEEKFSKHFGHLVLDGAFESDVRVNSTNRFHLVFGDKDYDMLRLSFVSTPCLQGYDLLLDQTASRNLHEFQEAEFILDASATFNISIVESDMKSRGYQYLVYVNGKEFPVSVYKRIKNVKSYSDDGVISIHKFKIDHE